MVLLGVVLYIIGIGVVFEHQRRDYTDLSFSVGAEEFVLFNCIGMFWPVYASLALVAFLAWLVSWPGRWLYNYVRYGVTK